MQHFKTPIRSGAALKCGRCGTGSLFRAYLKLRDECPDCGLDFTITDTADGPAFFVGFLAMILFTPVFIIVSFAAATLPGMIIGYALASLASLGFCLGLLPIFKGILFNLQIVHRSGECDFESLGTHGALPKKWMKFK